MRKLLSLALGLVLVFTMVACSGGSGANTPEGTVEAFLDLYKSGDLVEGTKYLEGETDSSIKEMKESFMEDKESKSSQAFLKAFSKIEYKIIDSEVNEDSAVVNTEITAPDLAKIIGELMQESLSIAMSEGLSEDGNSTDIEAMMEDKLLEKVNSDDVPMVTNTVSINLVKKDDSWLIKADNELGNAITGNLMNLGQ
ncbi:DUF4878 domain-containing protein [Clostridiisalibacter paucivorans]|uniref:DUF4878 domain-containing protein n=1 Tax=Clostridiisalibacter paucivorans TaxID=408753 RepID=UPI00047DA832|nr:DUF4878 domain-containing protein [Clostridiisalibacter paucivorans]